MRAARSLAAALSALAALAVAFAYPPAANPLFNKEDVVWPGPEQGCAPSGGVDLQLECALPAGKLTLSTDRSTYLNIECEPDENERAGRFSCEELHELTSAARQGPPGKVLKSFAVVNCELPPALGCALALAGARDALTVVLRDVPTALRPEHLANLTQIKHLRIVNAGPNVTRVPYEALGALPELTRFHLGGGALQLAEGWQPELLKLETLELTDGELVTIPPRAFYGLPQLRNLSLWQNKIEILSNSSLEGLPLLERLSLNNNALKALPRDLLLPTPRLKLLSLYNNDLSMLSSDHIGHLQNLEEVWVDNKNRTELRLEGAVFAGLAALRSLKLERCGVRALPAALLAGARALRRLSLAGNRLVRLPAGLLLHARDLHSLNLAYNEIDALPDDIFLGLSSLRILDLSNNSISRLNSSLFVGLSLENLSLSYNKLTMGSESERYSPLRGQTSLQRLALRGNALRYVMDDWRIFGKLDNLDLSYNSIENLSDVDTEFVAEAVVDLRHNNISVVRYSDLRLDPNERSKAKFLLDYNPFVCDCKMYSFMGVLQNAKLAERFSIRHAYCKAPPARAGKLLTDVPANVLRCDILSSDCPADCDCAYHPASKTLRVDCPSAPAWVPRPADFGATAVHLRLHSAALDLATLPSDVRLLNLSGLGLTVAPAVSRTVHNLTVDLTDNKLTTVPLALFNANCKVRLSGNELACDCKHKDDIAEFKRHWNRVEDFATLRCHNGALVEDTPAERLCVMRDAIVLGVSLATVGLTMAMFVVLAYKYSTEIRLVLRKWEWLDFLFVGKDWNGSEKTYDAFVSFSHHDDDFVQNVLVRRLEGGRRPLKLCLHYRDWEIGGMIPEQIDYSVRESRRTIVVLSKDFLGSMWAREEFRAAHGLERVIVLLLGDVLQDATMDKELRAYLTTNTYVHADDPLVWDRIRDAVRRTRPRAAPRPAPAAAPPAPAAPAVPADKLARSPLDVQLRDGQLVNGYI